MSRQCAYLAKTAALAALAAFASAGAVCAQQAGGDGVKIVYAMSSEGFPFGTVTMTRNANKQHGKRVVHEETVTKLNYGVGTERYSMDSTESVWIGPNGIAKYDARFTENGSTTLLKARWVDEALLVQTRFDEGEEWAGVEFEKGQFDFTSPEMPPLKRIVEAGDKTTLKWLSFYEMTVAPVKIELVGKESVQVGDKSFECDIIVFDNPSMGLSGKIWIAQDAVGPFLLKEEGRTPEGPFTMQVTEYGAR